VLADEERWWDFLMHGYLDHYDDPSGFQLDDLSLGRKEALYRFLAATLSTTEKQTAVVFRELASEFDEHASDHST
jgi:hypothetical protein